MISMNLRKSITYDDMEDSLISLLFNIKTAFGPTEVFSTIRKRPWIRSYLRDYYEKQLDFLQSEYYNSISEKKSS